MGLSEVAAPGIEPLGVKQDARLARHFKMVQQRMKSPGQADRQRGGCEPSLAGADRPEMLERAEIDRAIGDGR